MVSINEVVAQTGLDLNNPKLTEEVLAPALGERLSNVIPAFKDATKAIVGVMNAAAAMTAATTVLGGVGAMVAAVQGSIAILNGRVDAAFSESLKRSEAARENFVKEYYQLGSWSAVLESSCPSPAGLSLTGGTGQYSKYYVWSLDKAIGKSRIVPTWRTPPYDSPAVTPAFWGPGFAAPPLEYRDPEAWTKYGSPTPFLTPLSGYRGVRKSPISPAKTLVNMMPPVPAIPSKYRDKYWGGAPGNGKIFENKYDTALFNEGYGIPPGYAYLFSWGTYPYMSWSTNSEGYFGAGMAGPHMGALDLSAAAAAVAAAIHSITAIHARISADDVARCYANWLTVSGMRDLRPIPKGGQVPPPIGAYLDEDRLPWSTGDQGYVPAPFCKGKPINVDAPDADCEKGLKIHMGFSQTHWRVARDIELSFRSFFALRRAVIFQWDMLPKSFKEAAALGSDFTLVAMAKGLPLAEIIAATDGAGLLAENWSKSDPVGIWGGLTDPTGPTNGGLKLLGGEGGGSGGSGSSSAILVGGSLIVGGAALAAYMWHKRRK